MTIEDTIKKREDLLQRLLKSLDHMDKQQSISIITSWMSLRQMEEMVRAQEQ